MAGNTGGRVPNTPMGRALGAALRQLRNARNMSLRALAEELGTAAGVLSRYETGERTPSRNQVGKILTALGADEDTYRDVMALTVGTDDPLWLAVTVPEQRRQLDALVDFEHHASLITAVQPLLIPGLLQTQSYIRAVMADALSDRNMRVAIRIGRQEILTSSRGDRDPVRLIACIGEAALWKQIGSTGVMAEQMRHLLTMSELPNIGIHILRRDTCWTPADEGAFALIESDGPVPIVYIEVRESGLFLHDDDDSDVLGGRYRRAAQQILEAAASVEDSRNIISRYLNEWESA